MSKVIITIDSEDVATLREVFFLAVMQSEAYVEESDDDPTQQAAQNQVLSLMARIDAMLPDSTGFFDSPDLSGAVAAIRADMAEDGATDPEPYLDPEALAMYGVTVAEVRAALA